MGPEKHIRHPEILPPVRILEKIVLHIRVATHGNDVVEIRDAAIPVDDSYRPVSSHDHQIPAGAVDRSALRGGPIKGDFLQFQEVQVRDDPLPARLGGDGGRGRHADGQKPAPNPARGRSVEIRWHREIRSIPPPYRRLREP